MKDRWGNQIQVGWAEHEILWVKAAIKLPRDERIEAFQDIAAMTGRTEFAVRDKAMVIRAKQRDDAAILAAQTPRRLFVATKHTRYGPKPILMPSHLRPPSKAKLMGCR